MRQPKTHKLKCWPSYFQAVLEGRKPFELRKDDRDFYAGDKLVLREYLPGPGLYTGREVRVTISYVLWADETGAGAVGLPGLAPGFVVLGLKGAVELEVPITMTVTVGGNKSKVCSSTQGQVDEFVDYSFELAKESDDGK